MSEFFKVFDQAGSVTVQHVLAFVALVMPGFVSLHVYDALRGEESRQAKDALIDIVIYSIASDVVVFGATRAISSVVPAFARAGVAIAATSALLIIVPTALAILFFISQRAMIRSGIFPDALGSSWSHVVHRAAAGRSNLGAIVTFHDGRRVGARIGQLSRKASGNDQLLLDEVWTIDADGATLVEPSPGSYGVLINRADCQAIELVRLEDEATSLDQREVT